MNEEDEVARVPSRPQQIELDLFIPAAAPARGKRTLVPFLSTTPLRDWEWNEGHVRWSVGGVLLLDGAFNLYPWEQIGALVSVAELAAAGRAGSVNVPGSVIHLSTAPLDGRRVRLAAEIRAAHGNKAESREAVAGVRELVAAVDGAVRRWMDHIPLRAPARPSTGPAPGEREPVVVEMLVRLDALGRSGGRTR